MAKCDLSIELNDADSVLPGGGKVAGIVRVRAEADVQCNGLEVRSVWKTHGRGNVASGTHDSKTIFTGAWAAGEEAEYSFELEIADWPPTYHGHHLNIDHFVEAQAKIPWAFDPQASRMFLMRPTCGPEGARIKASAAAPNTLVGGVVATVVAALMMVFCLASAANPVVLFIIGVLAVAGGAFWLFRVFLPKFKLGEIECTLEREMVAPGEAVQGKLSIRPRHNVTINGIELRFEAFERCVSGSGSNKTTHRHVIYKNTQQLERATTLQANELHEFPFAVKLPGDAAYSVDLSDNDLIWSANLVVDIPRWPDWRKELTLVVAPSGTPAGKTQSGLPADARIESPGTTTGAPADVALSPVDDSVVTFEETANHLWSVRDNNDAAKILAEAVSGLSFTIEAKIERRLLYSGEDDPHVYPDGYAIWAQYVDPPLPLALYVPHELGAEFEQIGQGVWQGQGTVVGWDHAHRRLQIKVDRTE